MRERDDDGKEQKPKFRAVHLFRTVSHRSPDEDPDSHHERNHSPQRPSLGGGPCRLAVEAPLHRDAIAFDARFEKEIAGNHKANSDQEYEIGGEHREHLPFGEAALVVAILFYQIMSSAIAWRHARHYQILRRFGRLTHP